MAGRILVFAEQREGNVRKSSFEALGRAIALGDEVHGVLVGSAVAQRAPMLGNYGAKVVHCAEDPSLEHYSGEGYAAALEAAIDAAQPDLVLLIATAMGKDLAPRIAARKGLCMLSDCISLDESDGAYEATKSMYGGKVFSKVRTTGKPALATLRPSAYPVPAPSADTATVEPLSASGDGARARVTQVLKQEGGGPRRPGGGSCRHRWPWAEGTGKLRADRRTGRRAWRGRGRVSGGRRRGMDRSRPPGWPDRQGHLAEAVHRRGRLRCDPAPGGDAHREVHRGRQQRRRRTDLQYRRLRHRR